MSSRFSSPFMAKSPLNNDNLNRAERRLIDKGDEVKELDKQAEESYKESGDSKKTKKLEKKRDRKQARVERKLKRKSAKGKVDKEKMVDHIRNRKNK